MPTLFGAIKSLSPTFLISTISPRSLSPCLEEFHSLSLPSSTSTLPLHSLETPLLSLELPAQVQLLHKQFLEQCSYRTSTPSLTDRTQGLVLPRPTTAQFLPFPSPFLAATRRRYRATSKLLHSRLQSLKEARQCLE